MESTMHVPVGCVVFDETTQPDCGWYARDEEEARRFFSGQDLPESALWLTNVSYELGREVFQALPEGFCTHDYLREDLASLAARHRISDSRILAEIGARLLSRVLALCRAFLGQQHFLPAFNLRRGLKEHFGPSDMLVRPHLARMLEEATVTNTNCRSSSVGAAKDKVIFCLEPRRHCLNVLDQIFPYGRFAEVSSAELPGEHAGRADVQAFLRDLEARPGFFHISCLSLDAPWDSLFTFAPGRGERLGRGRRLWVSLPELSFLAEHADLTVHAAFLSASSQRLHLPQDLQAFFPESSLLSISCGVFFENLWNALAQTSRHQKSFMRELVAVNPLTAYLRAKDRVLLCETAYALKERGLAVTGYANGRIRVDRKGHEERELYSAACAAGCLPPYLALAGQAELDAQTPLALLQMWYAQGALERLLAADKLILQKITKFAQEHPAKMCEAEEQGA